MRFAIVIERAKSNFSAYVSDLPGCIATGDSVEEARREIAEAIEFHLDGMKRNGEPLPSPSAVAEYVEAGVAAGT